MDAPELYAITDRRALVGVDGVDGELVDIVAAAVTAGVAAGLRWVQVREKDLLPSELFTVVRRVIEIARPHGARVLVNDRVDVAVLAGADGVQLTELGLPVAAVRSAFPELVVGRSVHSLEAAKSAAAAGADFVLYGPVYATPSKAKYGAPQGIDSLAAVCTAVDVPVVAVGGISPAEVRPCRRAGAHGVAAIRGLLGARDVKRAVDAYSKQLAELR